MAVTTNDDRKASPPREADHASETIERDRSGRFRGCGNRRGRPKKVKSTPPLSLAAALAAALDEVVPVMSKGKPAKAHIFEIITKKLVNDAVSGSAIDRMRALRELNKLGALQHLAELKAAESMAQAGGAWSDELEEKYQAVVSEYGDEEADDPEPGKVSSGA